MIMRRDRREAHRVEVLGDLFLQVHDAKAKFRGDVMNLSRNGINFLSLVRVPLFREVAVRLCLPSADDHKKSVRVLCHGVVVRCTKRVQPFFEISLFFMDLAGKDRGRIESYIDRIVGQKHLEPH